METQYFDLSQATEEEIWAIWRGELQVEMTPKDEAMFYEYCGREIYAQHQRDYPNATYSIEIRRILPEDDPLGEGYFLEISRIQYEPEPMEEEPDYKYPYYAEEEKKAYEKLAEELAAQSQAKSAHYSDWWGVLNWFEGDKFYDATPYIKLHDELFGEKPLTYSAASQDLPF